MGLFDRVSRVVRSNLNAAVSSAENPEKILDQAIIDMQEDLVQMRQAVAGAIASQKRVQQQYDKAQSEASSWQQRAQLALQKGEEDLAKQALLRKKSQAETAVALKTQLDSQSAIVDKLKRDLIGLESKLSEAKTKRDMLKARASAARANEQLQSTTSSLNTSSAMAAFERMEDKVLQMEAKSQAAAELAGADLESQFAMLDAGSDVDAELASMKAQLAGGTVDQSALPPGESTIPASEATAVDAELEELRSQIDKFD
ncbi:PspA/IM30 family protein [Leptolyngbya sp. KIOST-1]|uniref:PspA/IM30 family protein n=1 Tax=Leptolyngbya sp. KIOST-1 TaxID=1229172 RepID=UPI00055B4697|nr:PspA/IM30 family protein [Leptolyngbya sp. KIOST-1]